VGPNATFAVLIGKLILQAGVAKAPGDPRNTWHNACLPLGQVAYMLSALKNLVSYEVNSRDPDLLGGLQDISFDDLSWQVRHLIVDTSAWLTRRLLIHPLAVRRIDSDNRLIELTVSRLRVEQAPTVDADEPLSRQRAETYYRYFGWPPYWQRFGPGFAGGGPGLRPLSPDNQVDRTAGGAVEDDSDPHLRRARALLGCLVQARGERVGRVDDLVLDTGTWEIKQLVVDIRRGWSGKHALIPLGGAARVDWAQGLIRLDLDPGAIGRAPVHQRESGLAPIADAHLPRR
jgi:sporulation protein YlmC with PRC-barrel domain